MSDLNVEQTRRQMAIVPQDHFLYRGKTGTCSHISSLQDPGTIRDNLCLGLDRSVSDTELQEACELAAISEFIQSLPDGRVLCFPSSTIAHVFLQGLEPHVVAAAVSPFPEASGSVSSSHALLCGSRRSSCSTRQRPLLMSRAKGCSRRVYWVFRRM